MAQNFKYGSLLVVMVIVGIGISCAGFFVDPAPVTIGVSPPAPSLLAGAKQQFQASCTFDDGHIEMLEKPMWASSNAQVVLVNESGMATTVAEGSATISATWEGISGSTAVSVVKSPLKSIEVTPINPVIFVNQGMQQFAATGSFADGTTKDITSAVGWSSSDTTIATISDTGLATALGKAGATTIQAASGNVKGSTSLTVRQVGSTTGDGSGNNNPGGL